MAKVVEMKPTYDATKHYKWNPEDTFILSGEQFASILNALRAISNVIPIFLLQQANNSVEDIIKKAVEEGTVKEMTEGETKKIVDLPN
jgi:hypothetical protein